MRRAFLPGIAWMLLLAVFCLAGAGCSTPGSPRDSLARLRTALLNHDADGALRYIDVDAITERLAQDTLNRYGSSEDALRFLGATVGRRMQPLLLPLVQDTIRKQLYREIASPEESRYFEYIRKAHIFYLNVTIEEDGRAFVKPKGKSDIAFRMARTDRGYWKIVQLILHKNEKKG